MTRLAAALAAAALTAGCIDDQAIPLAPYPDAALDARISVGADARRPRLDAAVDATPAVDATVDAISPDAIPPDAIIEPDATPSDAIPSDAIPSDAIPSDATPADATTADATPADATTADAIAPDATPPESCEAVGRAGCFGHPDCPDGLRCENIGADALPVPCCVPGPRGALPAGASCGDVDGQIACASGVCIDDGVDARCSTPCVAAADCPPALPRCVRFPFGETDFDWCFPD